MSGIASPAVTRQTEINSGLVWVCFFCTCLIYLSLWVVTLTAWHLTVSLGTLLLIALKAEQPLRQFGYILAILLFLVLLQILFSPYIRSLFLHSYREGFIWSDWRYLLLALERFSLPMAIVTSLQHELARPTIMARLTSLLYPLAGLGLNIKKVQMQIILALKFLPGLRREWDRFDQLQTYFVSKLPRRRLHQKLAYWQSVLKAMISHTLHQAVVTGDLLAIRGMPTVPPAPAFGRLGLPLLLWSLVGAGCWGLHQILFFAWLAATFWLLLTFISLRRGQSQ